MSITGRDFLEAAEKSLDDLVESSNRSAISRAYYAFYHEVCAVLTNCPPTSHEGVINYLLTDHRRKEEPYLLRELTQLGVLLKQQKTKRKQADYDLSSTISRVDAESSICTVRKMIQKLDSMRQEAA